MSDPNDNLKLIHQVRAIHKKLRFNELVPDESVEEWAKRKLSLKQLGWLGDLKANQLNYLLTILRRI